MFTVGSEQRKKEESEGLGLPLPSVLEIKF